MTGARYVMRNPKRVVLSGEKEIIFCGGERTIARPTKRPRAWSGLLQRLVMPQQIDEILDSQILHHE
ncbi:hypothetical protein, partial [Zhengella mangrovi]|uniref:hypothetical protein n=1 Tax=Zhengella mangrovi TaxID=1982044 RepID=UPI00197C46E0